LNADAVIEGGGVKGIGLLGAICEAEKNGYKWRRLAGTSAGAIIASLLAAGYTAHELKKEILELNYKKFVEKKGLQVIPLIGGALNLLRFNGVFSGDYIEEWVREKLLVKGVRTFKDLKRTLYIISSDITSGEMLVLPDDLTRYGIDPLNFSVAKAVRMSASIPYFFRPVQLPVVKDGKKELHTIVDGGLLSNFPVWIFDHGREPDGPTFGFRTVSKKTGKPNKITGPFTLGFALISTMLEAHDTLHIKEHDFLRTIAVPSIGINATKFDITMEEREKLFESGVDAGKRFFENWSYSQYVIRYHTYITKIN